MNEPTTGRVPGISRCGLSTDCRMRHEHSGRCPQAISTPPTIGDAPHTRAPWLGPIRHDDGSFEVFEPDDGTIAVSRSEANARLIAAAPELFELAKRIREFAFDMAHYLDDEQGAAVAGALHADACSITERLGSTGVSA